MWSKPSFYPGRNPSRGQYAVPDIVRLAPSDRRLLFEWAGDLPQVHAEVFALRGGSPLFLGLLLRRAYRSIPSLAAKAGYRCECIARIVCTQKQNTVAVPENGVLYALRVYSAHASSKIRLFTPCAIPGEVVSYLHPFDPAYAFSGRFTCSPSILRLGDGTLLCSHDVYQGRGGQNLTKLFRSVDGGKSFSHLTDLYPCFWGKLFAKGDTIYMLATSTEYGALLVGKSTDGGKTWGDPAVIHPGGSRRAGGPHRAPMHFTQHSGRIWTAVEYGSWQRGGHATGVLSAPLEADWSLAESWTLSGFLPYDKNWEGAVRGGLPSLLEGNLLTAPDGGLVNLLRYKTVRAQPDYGRAIYLRVDPQKPEQTPRFGKVIDFNGNLTKFSVLYDEPSGHYIALVNRANAPTIGQRNILSLSASRDLEHWRVVHDILNYAHLDAGRVAFQYPDFLIDGNDLLILSRTAFDHAENFHNANCITFHTLPNFRQYLHTMEKLGPCPAGRSN